ncbi:MAG: YihY family inner membrane protein [Proteobacteria bacterium]|nr:YihY family inner membrane protein [Pseudomonadota bacterium]
MLKKIIRISVYIYKSFFANDCANRAASLAYTTLLSLVPIIMLSFWILSLFPVFTGTGEVVQQFVIKNFVTHSAQVISEQLNHFLAQIKVLSWSSLLALGIVSVLMLFDMVAAFNSIWHVETRHLILSISFYSLAILVVPIFVGVFILFSSYLATLFSGVGFVEKPLIYLLPYACAFFIFSLCNWILPSCKVPLRYAILSGLITTILFEVTKYLFSLYISYFPTYKVIYGALAVIPIFLLWIYLCWVIILLGAVICQTMTKGVPGESNEYH